MTKIPVWILLWLVVCSVVGCEVRDPNQPRTYPTTVTLTMQGQPVAEATVTLAPVDPANTNSSFGQTDSRGVCKLTTFKPGDGVVPGQYNVAVRKVETITESVSSDEGSNGVRIVEERHVVPRKYGTFGNGLQIEVTAGGPNQFSFELDAE